MTMTTIICPRRTNFKLQKNMYGQQDTSQNINHGGSLKRTFYKISRNHKLFSYNEIPNLNNRGKILTY